MRSSKILSCVFAAGVVAVLPLGLAASAAETPPGLPIGRTQSAGVEGVLMCEGEPAAGVMVKLYDDDGGIDPDDLMAETRTDSRGHFQLQGYTHEITTIEPNVNIYHDCNDGNTPCQRKISFMVPDKYVYDGKTPDALYNAGRIELAGKFQGESRDCIPARPTASVGISLDVGIL
ncbi:transthyretin-like family protein [Actinomycetota bacterium Odt1-20B]